MALKCRGWQGQPPTLSVVVVLALMMLTTSQFEPPSCSSTEQEELIIMRSLLPVVQAAQVPSPSSSGKERRAAVAAGSSATPQDEISLSLTTATVSNSAVGTLITVFDEVQQIAEQHNNDNNNNPDGHLEQQQQQQQDDLGPNPSSMSCNAWFSSPCARTTSKWLAMKTAKDLTDAIKGVNGNPQITIQQAWQIISDGRYNIDSNFYPFVVDKKTGDLVAHGGSEQLVGINMRKAVQLAGLGFFDVEHMLQNCEKAANAGGGWVEYYWGYKSNIYRKSSYFTNLTDDYMVAVGYHNTPYPRVPNCNADYDSWCSLTNVRSLVGQAQFLLSGSETLGQFEKSAYELSFDKDEYQISKGFYIFMYNYDGRLVSHAHLHEHFGKSLADIFVTKELGTHQEGQQLHEKFIRAADRVNNEGGWVQYPWKNQQDEPPFTKVAYIIKIPFEENSYYLGVGFTFRSLAHYQEAPYGAQELPPVTSQPPPPSSSSSSSTDDDNEEDVLAVNPSPSSLTVVSKSLSSNDTPPSAAAGTAAPTRLYSGSLIGSFASCTDKYNLPCSFRTANQLSSHAMTHGMSSPLDVNDIWNEISFNPSFRSNDFYIFAYDFNGTLVAHGARPDFVGMTMQEIYDAADIKNYDVKNIHQQFKEASKDGGGYVIYDWPRADGTPSLAKIAFMWGINVGGRPYYAGVGFYHVRAPIEEYSEIGTKKNGDPIPCSAKYDLECSMNNAKAIVGQAAAELTLVSSQIKVRETMEEPKFKSKDEVLTAINNRDPAFAFNDFNVSVFDADGKNCPGGESRSGCCRAHGGNPSYVNKTWDEILEIEGIKSIPGFILHRMLTGRALSGVGTTFNYSYAGPFGQAQTKKAVVALVRCAEGDMYVVAEHFANPQPPTCDSCPGGTECTEATQSYCKKIELETDEAPLAFFIAVPVVVLLSLLFVLWYKRRSWKKRKILADRICHLEKQMEGMVEIIHDTGVQAMTAEDYMDKFGHVGVGAGAEQQAKPKVQVVWYWEESDRFLSRHHSSRIMQGEKYIRYLESSSDQIERAYQRWLEGKGFSKLRLDLTGKINKFDSQASGSQYVIDFEEMTQRNIWTEYSRSIRREQHVEKVDLEVVNRLPPLPVDINFFGKQDREDFLATYPGQVIQVSKEHPSEQWLYGSVLYDPLLADAQNSPQGVAASEGLSRVLAMALHDRPTSGWFPAALSKPADVKVMQQLVESLGGEGVTNLKPPGRWKAQREGCVDVAKGTAEYEEVVHYFLAALYDQRDHVTVTGVQRVQSLPLWQSYCVKRETMNSRDAKHPENLVNNLSRTAERRWLFHGTTAEVIPKIVKQGFNRAFAGRNAVAFGKGVYFARDAAYSSHQSYSTPDSNGIQRMFLCRVAVGDWCKGNNGQLTPDPKPRNRMELFDSTVDDVSDPTIFVVYHDAQAYPEYLVAFRRHDEENS